MESSAVARGYRSQPPGQGERAGRSRSPVSRRVTASHSGVPSPRRVPQPHSGSDAHVFPKWKTEEGNTEALGDGRAGVGRGLPPASRGGGAGPREYAALPDTEMTRQNSSEHPELDQDGLMTFRTFVITRVDESSDGSDAVEAYAAYQKEFQRRYASRVYWSLRDLPLVAERYNAAFYVRQVKEMTEHCRLEASQFVKLLAEERFFGLSLVDRFSPPRPALDYQLPFRLVVGPALLHNEAAQSPLTAPFWLAPDPDAACLCWRNVPLSISKWEIKDHLTEMGAAEGLVDVTMTVPDAFVLTWPLQTGRPDAHRSAWIKYSSEEACAAADIKLDGSRCGTTVCRPVRRLPNISAYTFRVAPSETCHPARILRDLHISARLILKLDKAFGVSELMGGNSDTAEVSLHHFDNDNSACVSASTGDGGHQLKTLDDMASFETVCSRHPVLADLCNVLRQHSGRSAEEQLDLQLLYLRIAHNVCYYSGRRFNSQRELWNTVGVHYVRPAVTHVDELVSVLPGFGVEEEGWDEEYIEGADVWGSLIDVEQVAEPAAAADVRSNNVKKRSLGMLKKEQELSSFSAESNPHDALFLHTRYPGVVFEPPATATLSLPLGESQKSLAPADGMYRNHKHSNHHLHQHAVKAEGSTAMEDVDEYEDPLVKPEASSTLLDSSERPYSVLATSLPYVEHFPRGRSSPWLHVLDARLRFLFQEDLNITPVDETSEAVKDGWASFCDSVIERNYDNENKMEKWICHICFKQFRGVEYVQKHLRYKHQQYFQDVLTKVSGRQTRRLVDADPYKLPVPLPPPTPYLYRMKNFQSSTRWQKNQLHSPRGAPLPGTLTNANNAAPFPPAGMNYNAPYTAFMGYGMGPRLGPTAQGARFRQYRDWDAPPTSTAAPQGNVRDTIFYNDL